MRARTVGVIEEDPGSGIVKYGKPVGVVGAVCPSTNPAATPVNKAMMALKGGNAVIIAPSPAGYATTARTVELMRAELAKTGHPADLVQILPAPVTKEMTQALLELCDLAVVTGSQNNVKRAMQSGTPAIGVGAGNVPVIIDETADLDDAAAKITASKIFDNATSCSSENAVIVLDAVYEDAIAALQRAGGWRCSPEEKARVAGTLWVNGKLNRHIIAKDADVDRRGHGPAGSCPGVQVLHGRGRPGRRQERLRRREALAGADGLSRRRLRRRQAHRRRDAGRHRQGPLGRHPHQGHGHARELAAETDVVRVLVNQAHTFGNGGSFDNALPFTLSMGCGTWAGNTISENLNWRHFINVTHLVTTIPEDKPSEEDLFGAHWARYGK